MAATPTTVSPEQARRIAVRAQLLDGSATGVRETVQRLGFLQIDAIATVAPPQHLVLWSRLGSGYDRGELERLLWEERSLFEWSAFIWPIEDLPLVRARMRAWPRGDSEWPVRARTWLRANASFRRYVLRELGRRGPLLSRELDDRSVAPWPSTGWTNARNVTQMLAFLASRGDVAIVGRRGGQRLWGLGADWYPDTERVSLAEAERILAEKRFRARGVDFVKGEWHAHPEATDPPIPDRATLLSPFDRLIYDRERAEALWGFRYRLEMYVPKAKREYGYYVLPLLVGDEVVGRAEPRFDPKTRTLELLGAWGDTSRLGEAMSELAAWLGASTIK